MKVTIAMSIGGTASFTQHDKGSCLPNVFFSIINQVNYHEYDIRFALFNHHTDDNNLRDVVSRYVDMSKVNIQSGDCESFTRLNTKFSRGTGIVDEDTDIVFYQSCDTIWYDVNILHNTCQTITDKDVVVSTNTQDVHVPYNLCSDSNNFTLYHDTLTNLLNNTSATSRARKNAKFMYLGAMRKYLWDLYTEEPFMCDLTQHNFFEANNIEFIVANEMSIHQKHRYTVMPCLDFHNCNSKYGSKASCGRKRPGWMMQETIEFINQHNQKRTI